ncbi:unnamed protein product [Caretta caretta]
MSSINSSYVWVTPSLPQDPLSRRYSEDSQFFGQYHIIWKKRPFVVLLVFVSCAVGALLRTILKESNIPIIVILCLFGILLGLLGYFIKEFSILTEYIAEIDPLLFLHMFTPVIIFTAAFEMDFYIFRKSFWQWDRLSEFKDKLSSESGDELKPICEGQFIAKTSLQAALDAADSSATGLSKIVINLIKGESLFNDATTAIVFELYRDLISDQHAEFAKEIVIKLVLKFFGSTIFGFLSSRIVIYWLSHVFNDGLTEVILSFSMTYMIFFIAEWIGMSGVISLTVLGILLDSVSFSPGVDEFIFRFWSMLTFLAHVMIFIIIGIVIAVKSFPYVTIRDLFYILTLYLALNLIRGLVVMLLSPLLSRLGYGFNWRWGAVIVWSGMRGTFTLNMALGISQSKDPGTAAMKNMDADQEIVNEVLDIDSVDQETDAAPETKELSKIQLEVALGSPAETQPVEGTTSSLCNITLPKRMAMYSAVQRIKEMEANAFSMLKLDRFLADANWTMTEEAIKIDYPYKASYQKQYHTGMLNQDAAQTLIGAAESYVDIRGKDTYGSVHTEGFFGTEGLEFVLPGSAESCSSNITRPHCIAILSAALRIASVSCISKLSSNGTVKRKANNNDLSSYQHQSLSHFRSQRLAGPSTKHKEVDHGDPAI